MKSLKSSFALVLLFVVNVAQAQTKITSPKEFFGHNIDAESDRMQVFEIGKTAEGRPQLAAVVTAPENFRNLARYKEIARKLAYAEGVSEADARAMAKEGKAVVWIDGGLHATEVLG